jgi:hypothetical protein
MVARWSPGWLSSQTFRILQYFEGKSLTYKITHNFHISMEGLYKLCLKHDITPNELMVLYTISINHVAPERIKRDLNIKDMIYRELVSIKDRRPILSTKGKAVLDQAVGLFLKSQTKRDLTKDPTFLENVEAYQSLWPKVNRIINGRKYPLRDPIKEVVQAFNKFFTDYPNEEWNVIFEVTQKYINSHRDNMDYMLGSKTFVYKTEAGMSRSRLAAEIESKDSKSDDDFIPDFLRPKSV